MAKAMIPIIALAYEEAFDLDAYDVFVKKGASGDDDYTLTIRVNVADPRDRTVLREALRGRLLGDQAERLIKLLDDNEWDVSFLVDCF